MALLDPLKVKVEFDLSALDNANDDTLDKLADLLWERIRDRMLRAQAQQVTSIR